MAMWRSHVQFTQAAIIIISVYCGNKKKDYQSRSVYCGSKKKDYQSRSVYCGNKKKNYHSKDYQLASVTIITCLWCLATSSVVGEL